MFSGQRNSLPLHYCIYSLMKQQTTFLDFTLSNSSLSLTTHDRFKHYMLPQPNARATCFQRSQFLLDLYNITGPSKKLCFPSPTCSNTDPDLSFIYTADSSIFPKNNSSLCSWVIRIPLYLRSDSIQQENISLLVCFNSLSNSNPNLPISTTRNYHFSHYQM